jgi:hypothetical protein
VLVTYARALDEQQKDTRLMVQTFNGYRETAQPLERGAVLDCLICMISEPRAAPLALDDLNRMAADVQPTAEQSALFDGLNATAVKAVDLQPGRH